MDGALAQVETVAQSAIKMGFVEKEAEGSYFRGWQQRFLVLTGWDDEGEAFIFYYQRRRQGHRALLPSFLPFPSPPLLTVPLSSPYR